MSHPDDPSDIDFDSQLQGLFQQAERALSHRGGKETEDRPASHNDESATAPAKPKTPAAVPDFLKPVIAELEAVSKATADNTALLKKIDPSTLNGEESQKGMLQLMADLRAIVEARNGISQNMFSALHQELKGYKDGFLLQTVHRPIIRDLVTLYDDVSELHRQLIDAASGEEAAQASAVCERVRQVATNMSNNMDFILEVLARLEVTVMEPGTEKLDKLTQKAVNIENAESPEEDGVVVRSLRKGFVWKEAVLRPEEVVIKKWKRGVVADSPASPKQ